MMKRMIALLLAALMAAAALSGCGGSAQSSTESAGSSEKPAAASSDESAQSVSASTKEGGEPTKFKLMYTVWVGSAPLFIAQEKGFFEKYGIAPELVLNEDESQTAALLVSNSVQAESCVVDKVVSDYASGTDEKIGFIFDESSGGDGIIASADIKTVEDLAGKKVGIDTSSTEFFFLYTILSDHGMTMDDLKLVDMDSASAGAAFLTGELDAAVVWEPWLTNASQRKGGHVLVSSAEYPRVIMDSLVVSGTFYKEHPEAVPALRNAWSDAVDYYKENPEESIKIMAKGLDLTVKDMKDMIPGVKFLGNKENAEFFDEKNKDSIYALVQKMADFWIDQGVAKKDLDVSELVIHP